jgi:transposase
MPVWNLPKGEEFLPGTSLKELRKLYREETKAKPKLRLLCAIHRKEGKSLDDIVDMTNMKRRTVHAILKRFIERGVDAKESIKQEGRPNRLTEKQQKDLIKRLEQGPPHNRSGLWSTKEVRALITEKYGIEFTVGHVWEMLKVAGFSLQRPRLKHYKSPPAQEVNHFKKRLHSWRRNTGKWDS